MRPTDVSDPQHYHRVVDCQWACPAHTDVPEYIQPLLSVVVMQLLAYHVAVAKGTELGEKACYLAILDEAFPAGADPIALMNSMFEEYVYDGTNEASYRAVVRWLNFGAVTLGGLKIRFTEDAVKRGAIYNYNETGQVVTPDLTWFPGKAV